MAAAPLVVPVGAAVPGTSARHYAYTAPQLGAALSAQPAADPGATAEAGATGAAITSRVLGAGLSEFGEGSWEAQRGPLRAPQAAAKAASAPAGGEEDEFDVGWE